jgi:hypothetical protein
VGVFSLLVRARALRKYPEDLPRRGRGVMLKLKPQMQTSEINKVDETERNK